MRSLKFRQLLSNLPVATIYFALLNTAIFLFVMMSGRERTLLLAYGFGSSNLAFPFVGAENNPIGSPLIIDSIFRSFSYMFMHTDVFHLVFNIVGLLYFGYLAEKAIGPLRWIIIYVVSGVISAATFTFFASFFIPGNEVLVGSSGAIAGLVGVVAAFDRSKTYYWLIAEAILAVISYATSIPIASVAHLAGFVAGLCIAKVLIKPTIQNKLESSITLEDARAEKNHIKKI